MNDLLRVAHDDVTTLRRELVDSGFLERVGGVYQVTRGAPARSRQVQQEITGDEHAWFRALFTRAIDVSAPVGTPASTDITN